MRFILRRLLMTIPVLLGVTLVTFAIIKATPGDPVLIMLGQRATPERVAELRQQLGLDDPLLVQYTRYVANALRGDLGTSIRSQTPVVQEIMARLPSTLQLTTAALLISAAIGIPAGVIAATTRSRVTSGLLTSFALVGLSIPNFWLAILALIVFGVNLGWISVIGGEGVKDLILPALTLGFPSAAALMRLTRASVLATLSADFVRTSVAKGLTPRLVLWKHVLRNALIPLITALGLQAGALLSGAVLIESVFARPGLGRYAVTAILNRDFPQIQGMVLFASVVYVAINLIIDLLYRSLDPRIRY